MAPHNGGILLWFCYGFKMLYLPHFVEERTLTIGIVLDDLAVVLSMCLITNSLVIEGENQYFVMCVHV